MVSGGEGRHRGAGRTRRPFPTSSGCPEDLRAAAGRLERDLRVERGSGPCSPRGGSDWARVAALVASARVLIAFRPRLGFFLPAPPCFRPNSS